MMHVYLFLKPAFTFDSSFVRHIEDECMTGRKYLFKVTSFVYHNISKVQKLQQLIFVLKEKAFKNFLQLSN